MHCLVEERTHSVQKKNRAFLLLVNKSLLQEQFVCSPTSILILFISSFFLSALAALFCFSIHLLSSRLQRENVVSSALIHNAASVTVRNSATNNPSFPTRMLFCEYFNNKLQKRELPGPKMVSQVLSVETSKQTCWTPDKTSVSPFITGNGIVDSVSKIQSICWPNIKPKQNNWNASI